MTDRELLELAAKAAGIDVWLTPELDGQGNYREVVRQVELAGEEWNPLVNDAQALRLAVKLRMSVRTLFQAGADTIDGSGVHLTQEHFDEPPDYWTVHNADPYAATRRAIVRAAAEIGARECGSNNRL